MSCAPVCRNFWPQAQSKFTTLAGAQPLPEISLSCDGDCTRGPFGKLAARPERDAPAVKPAVIPLTVNPVNRRTLPSWGFSVKFDSPQTRVGLVNFSVNVRQAQEVSLVEVTGRLTSFEAKAFRDMILALLKQGHTNIVLNLTSLEYLDSSGIGELVRNYLSVVKKGGAMKVVGLAPRVEEILKVTQLYQVFPEFPDEASALQSFPVTAKHPLV